MNPTLWDSPQSGPRGSSGLAKAKWPPVAAIVSCHNYGRYLAQCLDSCLAQTVPFAEIFVVDDASTDETAEVARRYAERGVKYLRVEYYDRVATRLAGLKATRSPVVIFVDADDWLAPSYLELQLPLLADRNVGIVYGDYFRIFENGVQELSSFPPNATAEDLVCRNVIPNISLVRREALEISRALAPCTEAYPEDWARWRAVLKHGWLAVKGPGLHFYRRHGRSWSDLNSPRRRTVYELWGLSCEPITIAVPLSGRWHSWPKVAHWLEHQQWPAEQVELLLLDTGSDPTFSRTLRHWAAGQEARSVEIVRLSPGDPGLAEEDRRGRPDVQRAVEHAMCRIWITARTRARTDWILTLEDDVIPPLDVIERLFRAVDRRDIGAVFCPYKHRYWDHYCAWSLSNEPLRSRGQGIISCGGAGFGCALWRAACLRSAAFGTDLRPHYDPTFCEAVRAAGWRLLLRWDCECEHLTDVQLVPPPTDCSTPSMAITAATAAGPRPSPS